MRNTPSSATPQAEHDDFMKVEAAAKDLKCGVRWLRDGANRPDDGSKGPVFPHHRLGGSLQFSRQDRAEIRAMHRVPGHLGRRPTAARGSRKTTASKTAAHKPARAAA
jgi:hypothetical protein